MKIRKQRRLVSWLLVLMMVLNVFSPLNIVWAGGSAKSNNDFDSVIKIHTDAKVASSSEADKTKEETETDEPADTTDVDVTDVPKLSTSSMASKPVLFDADPEDVTEILTETMIALKQNNKVLENGDTIDRTKDLSAIISFRVPVQGDEPTPAIYVNKNDTAHFSLGKQFSLTGGTTTQSLKFGKILIGHLTLRQGTDSEEGEVVADILFDGDNSVFDGSDPTINTVRCEFTANLKYNETGDGVDGKEVILSVLDKTFTLQVPGATIDYALEKKGSVDLASKEITWTVTIEATKLEKAIDLSEYIFEDDLTLVGNLVPGSFTVSDDTTPAYSYDETNKKLSYTFPANSISPKTITFKTSIPDKNYYGSGKQTVKNKAILKDQTNTVVKDNSGQVDFTPPKWIEKSGQTNDKGEIGGDYSPSDRTITWTIIANHEGADLKNVIITDKLPEGLTFLKATLYNPADDPTGTSITPTGNDYELGNINSKVKLVIETQVPDTSSTTTEAAYTNHASITWDEFPSGVSGGKIETPGVGITIGYAAIKKTGVPDPKNRTVNWKVTVDARNQTDLTNLKVYDLLVYGDRGFDAAKIDSWPVGITANHIDPKTIRYNQKYNENFKNDGESGVKLLSIHTLTQGGTPVADLLEFTNLSNTRPNIFSFDTLVLNPDIFASNTNKRIYNTAMLFNGTTKLAEATADPEYKSKILSKEMLKRDAFPDPTAVANANMVTTTATDGFNYQEKSVIYRLSVNADNMDLTGSQKDGNGSLMGAATVTDTLPVGWEFSEIIPGQDFLIFEATPNTSPLSAKNKLDTVAGMTVAFDRTKSPQTASFTFQTLNKPFVILVKAKPTEDTIKDYFSNSNINTVRNSLGLKTENWQPGVSVNRDVSISNKIFNKADGLRKEDGVVEWKLTYMPYELSHPGQRKIEDTLPIGLDLRMDKNGNLLIEDNITVKEMTLKPDCSYETGSEVSLELGKNIFYNNALHMLTFIIPDNSKAYQLTYLTDVTGPVGDGLSNTANLTAESGSISNDQKTYFVLSQDGSATLQRNGWLDIFKTDGANTPIAGAKFTLFTSDGATVIREGISDRDGKIRLKVIPDGTYLLNETTPPNGGYSLEGVTHTVTITRDGSTITTSIDGKTGTNSNELHVQNFKDSDIGSLTISKTVEGNAGDRDKAFTFHVTVEGAGDRNYPSNIGNILFTNDNATILLKHGEYITISNLPSGAEYTVTEDAASLDNHLPTYTGQNKTITSGEPQVATVTNTKNEVSISKRDAASGNELPGATLQLWKDDTKVDEWVSESTPHIIYNLQDGIYKLVEITAPKGYLTAEKILFTVTDGKTTPVVMFDSHKDEIVISKQDITNGKELPGATLQLWKDGTKIDEWVSEDKPYIIEYLEDGTYELVEIAAPKGYLTAEKITFIVKDGKPDKQIIMLDKPMEISISKQDITNGKELPGATLQLWKDGKKVSEWISENKPHIVKYLEDGTYELVEITAPKGYLKAEKITFIVKDGKTDKPVIMYDKPVEISISKQDITNGKELPGATLQLWKDGKKVKEWISEDKPHVIEKLEDGTYELVEISAPRGYLKAEKIIFTVKDGKTDSPIIMKDKPYTPSTGGGSGGGGGGPKPPKPTTPTTPIEPNTPEPAPKPKEELPPQEHYDVYGEVPRGYIIGPDNKVHTPQELYDIWGQVPLGYMVGTDGQLVPLGLPKTGDDLNGSIVIYGLLSISALLGMAVSVSILRRKHTG